MGENAPRRVAIIGAGPTGVHLAMRLLHEGNYSVKLYEQGLVGGAMRKWSEVKLFSPWEYNKSPLAEKYLRDAKITLPEDSIFPTAAEYIEQYLEPVVNLPIFKGVLESNAKVVSVCRDGIFKVLLGKQKRVEHRFRLLIRGEDSAERIEYADYVFDTSGVKNNPGSVGTGGIHCPGELQAEKNEQILRSIPTCAYLKALVEKNVKHVVVLGSGYSAITTLKLLISKNESLSQDLRFQITWITHGGIEGQPLYVRFENDPLPERDYLAKLGNDLQKGTNEMVRHLGGRTIDTIAHKEGKMTLSLRDHGSPEENIDEVGKVDILFANTGYKPDWEMTRELQVHYCYASEGPMALAAALLAAKGSTNGEPQNCLANTSQGADSLRSPEPNFFILGEKSYGRNSSFLIKLGLQQIDEVVTIL